MKLELSENMYVRTKDGYISQYKYYDTTNIGKLLCIPLSNGTFANIEDIIKASYNIIDILEERDYVNGYPICEIIEYVDDTRAIIIDDNDKTLIQKEQDIKTIITHEQMEQMAYKVGE